jgi:cytochrome c
MNRRFARLVLSAIAVVTAICFATTSNAQKGNSQQTPPDLMIQYGCPTCHVIPKVPGAVGKVGPSLDTLSQRSYLAGSLPNTPENLIRWIMHPQKYRPGTAMPEMGVTEQDARMIASFLQSVR